MHRTVLRTTIQIAALAALLGATRVAAQDKAAGPAADTIQLTLDEAVRRAVEHNPDLAVVRLGTEVEAARVGETKSAFLPVFSSTLGRSSTVVPPSSLLTGDQGVNTRDWFSSTGVRQRLPWGSGTWNVSW